MLRNDIKGVCREVKDLYTKTQAGGLWAAPIADDEPDGLKTEMTANIILCYRHLEDAAMRLGKAIQAKNGGVSVYDKQIKRPKFSKNRSSKRINSETNIFGSERSFPLIRYVFEFLMPLVSRTEKRNK